MSPLCRDGGGQGIAWIVEGGKGLGPESLGIQGDLHLGLGGGTGRGHWVQLDRRIQGGTEGKVGPDLDLTCGSLLAPANVTDAELRKSRGERVGRAIDLHLGKLQHQLMV